MGGVKAIPASPEYVQPGFGPLMLPNTMLGPGVLPEQSPIMLILSCPLVGRVTDGAFGSGLVTLKYAYLVTLVPKIVAVSETSIC